MSHSPRFTAAAPPPQSSICGRIHSIDTTRGLAVLGILLLNIFSMGVSYYDYVPFAEPAWSDKLGELLYFFVLRDRFMSLFAMLFGVGLFIQWQRFRTNNGKSNIAAAEQRIKRRLYWLLVFGLLHRVFIWPGDILFNYAICGLLLLRYFRLPPAQQLSLALRFIVMGCLLGVISAILLPDFAAITRDSNEYLEAYAAWTGDYSSQLTLQIELSISDAVIFPLTYMWLLLGLMLLGCYGYQRQWFSQGLGKLAPWLLPLSLVLSALAYGLNHATLLAQFSTREMFSEVLLNIAALPMSLWFIQGISTHSQRGVIIQRLQAVGRMPLSLYLLQSILGTLLLRHLMPELNLSLSWFGFLGIAIFGCVLQLMLAPLWFKLFRQGPIEWLWRKLAFGMGYQPLR